MGVQCVEELREQETESVSEQLCLRLGGLHTSQHLDGPHVQLSGNAIQVAQLLLSYALLTPARTV